MKHRTQYIALGVGAALVIGAVAFRSFVAPALVRFPLNVDETAQYRGTAITYADPKTGAPLSQPLRQPLTLDRRVRVVSGTATRAVVDETIQGPDPRTPEEFARDYQVPLEAVLEALDYVAQNRPLIELERDREAAKLRSRGFDGPAQG